MISLNTSLKEESKVELSTKKAVQKKTIKVKKDSVKIKKSVSSSKVAKVLKKTLKKKSKSALSAQKNVATKVKAKEKKAAHLKTTMLKTTELSLDDSLYEEESAFEATLDNVVPFSGEASIESPVLIDIDEDRLYELKESLAVAQSQYNEMSNQELASSIVFNYDRQAISLLTYVIESEDDIHSNDCAKVLREVASRDADLFVEVIPRLVHLMEHGSDEILPKVLWVLAPLGHLIVDDLWSFREMFWDLIGNSKEGLNITQKSCIRLLSLVCAFDPEYTRSLAGSLIDLISFCPARDVAEIAEWILPALGQAHSHRAKPVLDRRRKDLMPAEVARLRRAIGVAQQSGNYSAAA